MLLDIAGLSFPEYTLLQYLIQWLTAVIQRFEGFDCFVLQVAKYYFFLSLNIYYIYSNFPYDLVYKGWCKIFETSPTDTCKQHYSNFLSQKHAS